MAEVNIYNEKSERPKPKRVLLFSGGMDSVAAMHLWPADILLYAKINHRYQDQELDQIGKLKIPHGSKLIFEDYLDLSWAERKDAIIPLRNLYLCAMAARYGDIIGMGVLSGEVNGDKSEAFRNQVINLLNICYEPSYWCEGRKFIIDYPLGHLTKADLIKEYIAKGHPVEQLLQSRSCYSETRIHCGHCSNCVKRYMALYLNGLEEEYENDPRSSPILREFKNRWRSYDIQRREELWAVFGIMGDL